LLDDAEKEFEVEIIYRKFYVIRQALKMMQRYMGMRSG
jgi:hypothetical protein